MDVRSFWWDLGHMIKMAAMSIYSKNPLEILSDLKGRWPLNLVCSTGDSDPTMFVQTMTLLDPDLFTVAVGLGHLDISSRKHTYIMLTPLNPTCI